MLLYDSCPCSPFGSTVALAQAVALTGKGNDRANSLMTFFFVPHHSGLDIEYGSVKCRHATTRA